MKKIIVILSALFLLFVVAMAPAKLIENMMPQQSDVVLNGLTGSIWSGEIEQLTIPQMSFNNIKFSISPLALLMAKLSIDLEIPKGDIKGSLNAKIGSDYQDNLEFNNANLIIKTNSLQSFMPVKNASLEGVVSSNSFNGVIKNKKPSYLEGRVNWKNASVNYAGENWPLGDFSVELSTDNKKTIHGKLLKSENKLSLEGNFTLTESGVLEIIGSIATDTEQRLYQSFALFNNGKPANGRLPIKFKQKIY